MLGWGFETPGGHFEVALVHELPTRRKLCYIRQMTKAQPWALPCCIAVAVTLLLGCALTQNSGQGGQSNDDGSGVSIEIDLDKGHPVTRTLYGVFFEEASARHHLLTSPLGFKHQFIGAHDANAVPWTVTDVQGG